MHCLQASFVPCPQNKLKVPEMTTRDNCFIDDTHCIALNTNHVNVRSGLSLMWHDVVTGLFAMASSSLAKELLLPFSCIVIKAPGFSLRWTKEWQDDIAFLCVYRYWLLPGRPWALIQYKDVVLPVYCGDKTVGRSSYLHNGISYAGKMLSLYWISPQVSKNIQIQQSPLRTQVFPS